MLLLVWPKLMTAGESERTFFQESYASKLLNRKVAYAIHVPTASSIARWKAQHPSQRLRVVVFLPGYYDQPSDLHSSGLESDLLAQEASGSAAPAIWVAPEHFHSWYADRKDGSFPFERFLFEEWLPALEKRYPDFGGSQAHRTVLGFSMGGFGALNLAARSNAFSRCVALSPALIEPPFTKATFWVRRTLKRTFPMDLAAFAPWDPWEHMGGASELILGCGTEDKYHLEVVTRQFAEVCASKGRTSTLVLAPGGHNWGYWRKAISGLAPKITQPFGGGDTIPSATEKRLQ
jgi:esterase/lipase superfamily enzyme